MAHFYASIKGNRGMGTRMGTKNSGISGHIRGWNLGVRVEGWIDPQGNDYFDVYRTGGSSGSKSDRLITTVKRI